MQSMGARIHALRKNKGLTQQQLAEALCVSPQSVSKWENSLSLPDVTLLPMIARYFSVTMDELFGYRLDALSRKERFIRFMADNQMLQFGEFSLRSGRMSPLYIHTGRCVSASQLTRLGELYAECMMDNHVEATQLAGSGARDNSIVVAAALALYRRWGIDVRCLTGNPAEQPPEADGRVTLIRDTLTTGQSLRASIRRLRDETGLQVTDVIVSVDRMERGNGTLSALHEMEQDCGVRIHALVTMDDVLRALEKGLAGSAEDLSALRKYMESYRGNEE